ncbi:MAG: hypothetical protein GJT30_04225 [Geobacter sp.]|nr:hypothetical protein [Geobacter sp.]
MPPLRRAVRGRGERLGGSIGYPSERLSEEVAYIAYHFHWPHDEIMGMEHRERQRWVDEIARINERLNEER